MYESNTPGKYYVVLLVARPDVVLLVTSTFGDREYYVNTLMLYIRLHIYNTVSCMLLAYIPLIMIDSLQGLLGRMYHITPY
jgi:hypothetical protein